MTRGQGTSTNQVHVNHRDLYKTVCEMQKVARGSTLPILNSIRMKTNEAGELELSATDLNLYEVRKLHTSKTVGKIPPVLLDARILVKVLKPGKGSKPAVEEVEISALSEEKATQFVVEGSSIQLSTLLEASIDDWPAFPVGDVGMYTETDLGNGKHFLEGLRYVAQALGKDETRMNLWSVHTGKNTLTTTDGHRIHQAAAKVESGLLIPGALVDALMRVKLDTLVLRSEKLGNGKLITFFGSGWEIKMKEGDEQFPEFEKIFPTGQPGTIIQMNIAKLRNAIERTCRLSDAVGLNFMFSEADGFSVEVADVCAGLKAKVPVELSDYSGKDVRFGANYKYVLDAMEGVNAETVRIEIWEELAPILFEFDTDERAIVMPMRL